MDDIEELRESLEDLIDKYETLQERVTALEPAVVPVGSIVPFIGSPEEAQSLVSRGYWICDGRVVDDPESRFHGRPTPDMLGRTVLGSASGGETGEAEAKVKIPALKVETTAKHFTSPASNHGPRIGPHVGEAWGHYHRITSEGATRATVVTCHDVVPAHVSVLFLLRAR